MSHDPKYGMTPQRLADIHAASLRRFAKAWGLSNTGGYSGAATTPTQEGDQNDAFERFGAKSSARNETTELLANLDRLIDLLV